VEVFWYCGKKLRNFVIIELRILRCPHIAVASCCCCVVLKRLEVASVLKEIGNVAVGLNMFKISALDRSGRYQANASLTVWRMPSISTAFA
jgi:hypothetical protein